MKKYPAIISVLLFLILASTCGLQANALQVIDTTPNTPEPTGVQELFSKLAKSCKDKEDQEQINKILEEYQKNREDPYAREDAQIKLMTSSISSEKKLEVQRFLNNLK